MGNDIQKTEAAVTPISLLSVAVSEGADLEKLEKLMELQERWERRDAKKAYVTAMADFKASPPDILKDAHVLYNTAKGPTEYDHPRLGVIAKVIGEALSKHGLSASWKTSQSEKTITVTCYITHIMGHSESTSLSAPADETGGKNTIQAIGSAITYLQRYTLLSLSGLAAMDQDNDANMPAYVDEQQLSQLIDMVNASGADEKRFLKLFKVEALELIPKARFNEAMSALKLKLKKGKG